MTSSIAELEKRRSERGGRPLSRCACPAPMSGLPAVNAAAAPVLVLRNERLVHSAIRHLLRKVLALPKE